LTKTCAIRFTATAGTQILSALFSNKSFSYLVIELYNPKRLSSLTKFSWVKLTFIAQIYALLPLKKVREVLSPVVANHSFKLAKDLGLGKPLPYQLSNLARAYLFRQIPVYYSPVR